MGAITFEHFQESSDAPGLRNLGQAFSDACESAAWESGHGGYTGTIAEKHDAVVIRRQPVSLADARAEAGRLIDEDDDRIADKWGPAGAIPVQDGTATGWLFFGWASC